RSNQQAELLAYDPTLAALPSEYPLASPVVRLQAPQSPIVSNLRHEQITLAGLSRALVPLLNGRRTRDDLLAELLTMIDEGRLTSSQQQAIPPDQIEQQMANDIEHTLRWLGRAAILLS
ncbi:MAG: hypothetical protein JWM12_1024, partial [Ilumatobacteraceae bacterium]|nr:hypothetical protein [Ilumatobacteraceae bacterium]